MVYRGVNNLRVVLLVGPSSAGKSTICDELVKAHGWKAISYDEIASKIRDESISIIKPELQRHGVLERLLHIMTEEEILSLSTQGVLSLSQGACCVSGHQFSNPELPGLEQILTESGFDKHQTDELSRVLRQVAQIGDEIPRPDPVDRLYDEVFSLENEDLTVVVDTIPPLSSVAPCLQHFHERAEKFHETHHDIALTTHTVLAYCPPQFLSGRIEERNRKAEEANNPGNMRVGVFPFQQLSAVMTTRTQIDSTSPQHSLTKDELFNIVRIHSTQSKQGPLIIEEPFESSVLKNSSEALEEPNISVIGDRVVLINEDDLSHPIETESPGVGTVKQVQEYRNIRDQLGFHEYKSAMLSIREHTAYDAIIDTSKGNPETIAAELVTKLASLDAAHVDLGTSSKP